MKNNYFVHGEEDYLVQAKVNELRDKFSDSVIWAVERLDTWSDYLEKLLTQAMFSKRRVFISDYIVLEQAKPNIQQAEQILSAHNNILIIYAKSRPDKRTQLYKLLDKVSTVYMVQAPRGAELNRWLQKRARELGAEAMTDEAAVELIYRAGSDMFSLENELIKLIHYDKKISVTNIRALAIKSMQISIFDLVDSTVGGSTGKAMNMVEELYRGGAAEPYLLHMLARQYRLLFRFLFYKKKGYGNSEILKIIPMHPYAFQKMCRQAVGITAQDCAQSLQEVLRADYLFKTGQSQGLALLQGLIVKLAKK